MTRITRSRLEQILSDLAFVKAGVVGDFCLDAYWYADMAKAQLSRETPLFARPVVRETYTNGAAANVAWNLVTLGARQPLAFTVFGPDWRGDLLRQRLEGVGVDTRLLITQPDRQTPLFGKVILTNGALQQEDARLDFVNTVPLSPETEAKLLARLAGVLPELDVVIIADYPPMGVLTPGMRAGLSALAQRYPKAAFVADSRDEIGSYGEMVIKPNEIEAARLFFPDRPRETVALDDFIQASLVWESRTGLPVIITLGENGCLVTAGGEATRVPAVKLSPPIDTVGAGDGFLACLGACLGAKATPLEAAQVATLAAAVTVRKLHVTGTASPPEILDLYDSLDLEQW